MNNTSNLPFGLLRVTAACPDVAVGHPARNVNHVLQVLAEAPGSDVILLPELCLTGYTCGDLFGQQALLLAARKALLDVAAATESTSQLVVLGLPLSVGASLMNVAAVLAGGDILAIIPKQFIPNYREFYEQRWFQAGSDSDPDTVVIEGREVPFGVDLLVAYGDAILGIEICEDLWMPVPPSSLQALAGANVLLNLSASNEVIGKAVWRRDLIVSQSGRCIAAYAYASSGPDESTTDLVFGGHCLIAENGALLIQSGRVGDGNPQKVSRQAITIDVDIERLQHDRRVIGCFADGQSILPRTYRKVAACPGPEISGRLSQAPLRVIPAQPFVPTLSAERDARCEEIFGIQMAGLAKRVSRLPDSERLVIGVSGGLDSTLALLVAVMACDVYQWDRKRIDAITMPGFGTTQQTLRNAIRLTDALNVPCKEIDIRLLCLQTFQSLGHDPLQIKLSSITDLASLEKQLKTVPVGANDLVFENVQARQRTALLMNRGFVLGTGDMSEQALGWSTYNADHMSMYNVNTSIPKTLVRYLVRYAADHLFKGSVQTLLHEIADTPVSPELLPPTADGKIAQQTEQQIGAYELHDFFLYHMVRYGFGPQKIRYLAEHASFSRLISTTEITDTLSTFYRRFFLNQFKRSCVPDGPKVGTVSLSPRGDWRMPSDADQGPFQSP